MSELSDAAAKITEAAARSEVTTEFFDSVTTLGVDEYVTNTNNGLTVPSVQTQINDLYNDNETEITAAVEASETARDEAVAAAELLKSYPNNRAVIKRMMEGDTVTIMSVGDSITWGSNSNDPGTQVENPWSALLQENLRSFYDNELITVVNMGYSGFDSQNVVDQKLDELIAVNPDLTIIALGVNDARTDRTVTLEDYKNNMTIIANVVPDSAIMYLSPTEVPTFSGTTNGGVVIDYRNSMKQLAASQGNVFIDIHSDMQELLQNRGEVRGKINRDRLHWTQEGYQLIADNIFNTGFVDGNLKVKSGQFVDAVSQNLRGDYGIVVTNSQYTVSRDLDGGQTAKLFLYLDDYGDHQLTMHATVYTVTDEVVLHAVNVVNTRTDLPSEKYGLTILNSDMAANTPDYQISVCKLKKGLNIVEFTTDTDELCFLQGFTVSKVNSGLFSIPSDNLLVSNKLSNEIVDRGYTNFVSGFKNISGKVAITADLDYQELIQSPITVPVGVESRYRIRGNFTAHTNIMFGAKALTSTEGDNWVSEYYPMLRLHIRSTASYLYFLNSAGTSVIIDTISITPGDMVIDIKTSSAGTSFYLNGTLLSTIETKLPEMSLTMSTEDATGLAIVEYISQLGSSQVEGADIAGESYVLYDSNELAMVGADSVTRKVALA